jgi:DNA-directed RNA polymerase specialized sigma subunit
MEYLEQTIERLRAQLRREPTEEEIKAERDRQWRLRYADMWMTHTMFADEADSD